MPLAYGADKDVSLPPEIALLEFLGTTAGLESMGVNIDQLLTTQQPITKPTTTPPAPSRITHDER